MDQLIKNTIHRTAVQRPVYQILK